MQEVIEVKIPGLVFEVRTLHLPADYIKADRMAERKRAVEAVPPEEFNQLKVGQRKSKAAGMPAVVSAMKHIGSEMGLWKGINLLNRMNQKEGFDCPGCAWPDPEGKRSVLGEYCENGAKAIAEETTNARVNAAFFAQHSVEDLSRWSDYQIGKSGRLTEPMYLPKGESHYQPISWEQAFQKVGAHLKGLNHPDEAVFYTSGRTSNEAAYMYQLMVRQLGTNNLPDCSNMCHESSGAGLIETVGIGKGSVTLDDLHHSELVIMMGQNPGTNHPRMLSALTKCKKNGGTVVSINPIPESGNNAFVDPQNPLALVKGGTRLTDLYLQVKINGDIAVLKAVMLLMLEREDQAPGTVFDLEFIQERCHGYEDFIADLRQQDFQRAVQETGVPESQIRELAELLMAKKKIIICWAMGLTQHENGVHNIREVVNLLLLRGSIGKPGSGTCPVRGHSNVQGDRTMGIWEKPKPAFLDALEKRFSFSAPRHHGYDVVESIEAMEQGKVKVFVALGGNFISATPDSRMTGEAMQNCDLTVQISTKLNRSHLVTGKEALILPCISRSELDVQEGEQQFVTVENSMGVVHKSEGIFAPASTQLLSEHRIIASLAQATFGPGGLVNWEEMARHYDHIRDHIEATIPGFDRFNERVRQPGGFHLPNGSREGKFNTHTGKANFTLNPLPERTVAEGNFILMTIRTHDQYNTTIYGMDDRYRGIYNERRVVLMNALDLAEKGFRERQVVHLKSIFAGEERLARNFKIIPYDIARGCIATYFPEANVLVALGNKAKISNTPASKFVEVQLFTD